MRMANSPKKSPGLCSETFSLTPHYVFEHLRGSFHHYKERSGLPFVNEILTRFRMKIGSLLREPHKVCVTQAGKDWYFLQLRGCQHGDWCPSLCAGSTGPGPRPSVWGDL